MTPTSPSVVEPQVGGPEGGDDLGWRWPLGVAAVAVAVTIATRFVLRSPLWLDEALSANIAKLPLGQIPGALRADGHPPLYYWLLHGWMNVFGGSDQAVRALSGVFSVAALPVAYKLARDLAGRRAAVAALVLFSISPYCIRYGTEARMYSMVMFLVLLAMWALRSALTAARASNLVALGLVTGTLLLTHYWAIYLMVATVALLLFHARIPAERRRFLVPAIAIAAGALALVPWLGVFLDQRAHTGTPWAPPARPPVVVAHTVADLGGFSADGPVLGITLVLLALLAVFGRSDGPRRIVLDFWGRSSLSGQALVVCGTLALGTLVSLATGGAFETRYAAVVVPLVLLLAAVGATRFVHPAGYWGVLGVATMLAVPGVVYNIRTDRTQGGQVVDVLNAAAKPGDLVAYCPDQLGPAYSRGLTVSSLQLVRYPDFGDPARVDWRDYAARNHAADPTAFGQALLTRATSSTIWFVWNGGYRTLDGQCEIVFNTLSAQRRPMEEVGPRAGVFEPGRLTRFPAPAP